MASSSTWNGPCATHEGPCPSIEGIIMSDTTTTPTDTTPYAVTLAALPSAPSRSSASTSWMILAASAVVAIVLRFIGGISSYVSFPPRRGALAPKMPRGSFDVVSGDDVSCYLQLSVTT